MSLEPKKLKKFLTKKVHPKMPKSGLDPILVGSILGQCPPI
jgi:hypothetical protein